MLTIINPQPRVRRIDSGWDVSGRPYFMGDAPHHIGVDDRFQEGRPPGTVARLVDGVWYWTTTPDLAPPV
jgi:hypothetical protein